MDRDEEINVLIIVGAIVASLGITAGTVWLVVWAVKTIAQAIAS